MSKTIVLAFGGNAITKSGERGTWEEQWHNLEATCLHVIELIKRGNHIVITHGNGPQVGNILLKNEICKDRVPPMPLDVCVSNTQGSLGYAITQILDGYLKEAGLNIPTAAIITQVVIDPLDAAFDHPTKFIGPFYTQAEAQRIIESQGHIMKEDSGRGWRRVVPSPEPAEIVEKTAIQKMLAAGMIVVAAGGGGIPVKRTKQGFVGVEAVIDKDKAGELLAEDVEADAFFLLTEVDRVCIHYGKPNQKELAEITVEEARKYQAQGHFPPGSMGPKIEAAVRFAVSKPGRQAVIVSLENIIRAFSGQSGTIIRG